MVHLVPSKQTYTAKNVAELVFSEVYKHHGLPKAIVSDRDVLFTSTFWTHLHKLLGVELRMSSAYHPESDGSTERANRTITQMLRQCVGPTQKNWVQKLPAIEFAINTARSNSTGYAPFFLNNGRMPRSMIWENAGPDEYPGVRAYAQKVKAAIMAAHDSILASRVKQTRDANRRRRPSPFVKNDLVYVSTKNINLPKGLARKLTPKFMGPYCINKDFGNNSYQLDLPSRLKRRGIHDVFHSSLLRVHEPNDDRLFPGRADNQIFELEDQEGEWTIEKIIGHKGKGRSAIFECLWKTGDRTWVPYDSIVHLGALTAYLEALDLEDIDSLDDGTGVPPPNDLQVYVGHLHMASPQDFRSLKTTHSLTLAHSNLPPLSYHSSSMAQPTFDPASTRPAVNSLYMMDPSTNSHIFLHNSQLRAIFIHDQRLREGKVNQDTAIPAGYDAVARIIADNPFYQNKLAQYDLASGKLRINGPPFPSLNRFAPKPVTRKTDQEEREERVKQGSMMLVLENLLDGGGNSFQKGGKRRFKGGEGRNSFIGKRHKHSSVTIPLDSDDETEGASDQPASTTTTTTPSGNPPTAAQPASTNSAQSGSSSVTPPSANGDIDTTMGSEAQPESGSSSSLDKLKFKKTRSSKAASSGKGKKPVGTSDADELMDYHTGEEGY
ncbi:hypothetical protein NLI96_g11717 [Meripilus lineatus]|uniref:Integrase catalytic domain-containing protein n=1 Tax=Meripilus lineatus TaxID=2056292 RepID=A0AAD5YAK9_9APHY|nr:hypothetical protein NLI96_g11717 [Physisporinus lineatus]